MRSPRLATVIAKRLLLFVLLPVTVRWHVPQAVNGEKGSHKMDRHVPAGSETSHIPEIVVKAEAVFPNTPKSRATNNARTMGKRTMCSFMIWISFVKVFAENANKIILHKTGAMRSKDGSLPVLQYGALLCALKISHRLCADAPLRKHATLHNLWSSSLGKAVCNVMSTNPSNDGF